MKPIILMLTAFLPIGTIPAWAGETDEKANHRLPAPLGEVVWDLSALEKQFQVADCKYYAPDEFTVGGRIVAEETIVWTMEAKDALKATEIYELLHPNPAPTPFFKVRFLKMVDGKEVSADAKANGYRLIRDVRWIGPKAGPDLAKGEKLQVWVHLGKEGSAGLIEQGAVKLLVTAK